MKGITDEMQYELDQLHVSHGGRLPPEALIEHAKTSNAWHSAFEWDNTKAGHQYRLMQARSFIAVAKFIPAPDKEPIRAFAQFSRPDEGGYLSTADILADENQRARLVQTLITRHLSIYNSYQLEEFDWLKTGLDKMVSGYAKLDA